MIARNGELSYDFVSRDQLNPQYCSHDLYLLRIEKVNLWRRPLGAMSFVCYIVIWIHPMGDTSYHRPSLDWSMFIGNGQLEFVQPVDCCTGMFHLAQQIFQVNTYFVILLGGENTHTSFWIANDASKYELGESILYTWHRNTEFGLVFMW